MPARDYYVDLQRAPIPRAGIQIRMYEDGELIGVNGIERQTVTEFFAMSLVLHVVYYEFCYEKFHVVVYSPDGIIIEEFDLEVSVHPGDTFSPSPGTQYLTHHTHLGILPPPPFVPPILPPPPPPPSPPPSEPPDAEPPPPCGDLDRETYKEFRAMWGYQVDKVWFEVPLDDGVDVPNLSEPWRSVWKTLTRHRIDVVFERKGTLYVAEIKPRLSIAAIGTAIVARTMFKQLWNDWGYRVVKPAVICQYASPTLIQAAATHGVVIFVTRGLDGIYEPVVLHDVIF